MILDSLEAPTPLGSFRSIKSPDTVGESTGIVGRRS